MSDVANCGSCGAPCSTSHMATVTCQAGMCGGTCLPGWGNCDGDFRSNGCETDVSSGTGIASRPPNLTTQTTRDTRLTQKLRDRHIKLRLLYNKLQYQSYYATMHPRNM